VAEYLQETLGALEYSYSTNNEIEEDELLVTKEFKDLPGYGPFNRNKIDLLRMPEFGYNIEFESDYENNTVDVIARARKATADLTLEFRDNARGLEGYADTFGYGFNLEMFLSEIYEIEEGLYANVGETVEGEDGFIATSPSDATRIKVSNAINLAYFPEGYKASIINPEILAGLEDGSIRTPDPDDDLVVTELEYEFLSIDGVFDEIDDTLLDEYPTFLGMFEGKSYNDTQSKYLPQFVLLKELLAANGETIGLSTIKSECETIYNSIHTVLTTLVADVDNTEGAWYYGAQFDSLSFDDAKYVIADDTEYNSRGDLYGEAEVEGTDGDARSIRNSDMILGISRMQQEIEDGTYGVEGAANRVHYLDPSIYGGNYTNPAVYVTPMQNKGWLGLVDVLFPDLSPLYPTLPDDPRLSKDPECVLEVPYNRILNRSSKAFLQGLIMSAIRIYCSVGIVKAMPVFTKLSPRFPAVFGSTYASYIVETMEESFKDPYGADWELVTSFKDNEFWYAFLEQSVQMYAERVEREELEPPTHVIAAMSRLNDMQQGYEYPNREGLKEAKGVGADADRYIGKFTTLKRFRSMKNLEAIQETEEDAKLILKELVMEQLNFMSEKVIGNLGILGWTPDIYDIDYFLLDNMTQGSSLTLNENMDADGSVVESYLDLPTVPIEDAGDSSDYHDEGDEGYYTYGGQFTIGEDADLSDDEGQEYIGYYHVNVNDDNEVVYMAGEGHTDSAHDTLYPLVSMIYVAIGDVDEYGGGASTVDADPTKPFFIEKYISINGTRMATTTATEAILANDGTKLLSEVYPGTMELVYDDAGEAVGVDGELGVRYGLIFYVILEGTKYEVTSVEIDALDLPISEFTTISADSKLLLCLVNLLKDDDRFKLVTRYVFPLRKMASMLAIYVDKALLMSIGEKTVADGETWKQLWPPLGADNDFSTGGKPGMYAEVATDEDGVITGIDITGVEGWTSSDDRNVWSPFFMEWDGWDQILLRSSKSRIKRLFKTHYNSRDFDVSEITGKNDGPGQIFLKNLREAIKLPSGERILTRKQKRRLISNPFNADGALCEKQD